MIFIMEKVLIPRPVVLYDGTCGFCISSVRQWRERGEGVVEFASNQNGGGEAYGIPQQEAVRGLCLVEKNGNVRTGAEAVFRMMDLCESPFGKVAWTLHKRVWLFRSVSNWMYGHIAGNRKYLSRLSKYIAG
jgi:predicted DCC family thiol-disulfide oxidoreductase YuxK